VYWAFLSSAFNLVAANWPIPQLLTLLRLSSNRNSFEINLRLSDFAKGLSTTFQTFDNVFCNDSESIFHTLTPPVQCMILDHHRHSRFDALHALELGENTLQVYSLVFMSSKGFFQSCPLLFAGRQTLLCWYTGVTSAGAGCLIAYAGLMCRLFKLSSVRYRIAFNGLILMYSKYVLQIIWFGTAKFINSALQYGPLLKSFKSWGETGFIWWYPFNSIAHWCKPSIYLG
jgi:hypothetical protein